jgi:YfiH family protein
VSAADLIEWDAGEQFHIAFSTRNGGVSEEQYTSLNLGILTGDDPGRVVHNRERLCDAAGVDADGATMAWQRHGATVRRAEPRGIVTPGTVYDHCDGLWSDDPGQGMLLLTADCLAVALLRGGERPAVAVLHAGWRGLLAGIVAEGVRALGPAGISAVIGPAIGRCCYEVGEEVTAPFREAFGDDVASDGKLDLRLAAARALRAAGCEHVDHVDLCTACHPHLFFSHRRDGGRTGRQGIIARVAG